MPAPKKYPVEVRDRSIRLVEDLLADPDLQLSVTGACTRVGEQLGINRDTLRGWVKQAQIDSGAKPGLSTDQARRLKELEAENRELRRANAILKTASAFFAAGLDRPSPRSGGSSTSTATTRCLGGPVGSSGSSRSAGCSPSTACRSLRAPTTRTGSDRPVPGRSATRSWSCTSGESMRRTTGSTGSARCGDSSTGRASLPRGAPSSG